MEKIYTIPVNDAYTTECDCPICVLKKKSEEDYINYYLGPSLMEPDTRMITNRTGFCPDHMGMLNTREANRARHPKEPRTQRQNSNDPRR